MPSHRRINHADGIEPMDDVEDTDGGAEQEHPPQSTTVGQIDLVFGHLFNDSFLLEGTCHGR